GLSACSLLALTAVEPPGNTGPGHGSVDGRRRRPAARLGPGLPDHSLTSCRKLMPTALLVVDVQNILCAGTSKARDVEAVIGRINTVSRKARAAGALVVVVQHETTGGELDHGTDAWKLAPSLELHSTDVLLRKTASDAFLRTGLSELLASRGVTDLIVCGLQSEFCVDSTVRR